MSEAEGRGAAWTEEREARNERPSDEGRQRLLAARLASGQTLCVELVCAALADPTRRQLLETLSRCPPSSATTLAAQVPVSRQAVVKHLQILRDCELVSSHRAGKEVLFEVRPGQLAATASWMTTLATTWTERLARLKEQAES
jgi:DNA-binding transcriptional ArsR family regulator